LPFFKGNGGLKPLTNGFALKLSFLKDYWGDRHFCPNSPFLLIGDKKVLGRQYR
jgi:hypothetical protein